jgi:hypothetical protein
MTEKKKRLIACAALSPVKYIIQIIKILVKGAYPTSRAAGAAMSAKVGDGYCETASGDRFGSRPISAAMFDEAMHDDYFTARFAGRKPAALEERQAVAGWKRLFDHLGGHDYCKAARAL